jgi:hypothetical protein
MKYTDHREARMSNKIYSNFGVYVYAIPTPQTVRNIARWCYENNLTPIKPPYGLLHVSIFRSPKSHNFELRQTLEKNVVVTRDKIRIVKYVTGGVIAYFDHAYFINRHNKLSKEFGMRAYSEYKPHLTICSDQLTNSKQNSNVAECRLTPINFDLEFYGEGCAANNHMAVIDKFEQMNK